MKVMDPESNFNENNNLDDNEIKWQQERKRELEKRKERRIGGGTNDKKKE